MIQIFKTVDNKLVELEKIEKGVWINLINPTKNELNLVRINCNIDEDHLMAPLDEEESPRIDSERESILFLIDIPTIVESEDVTEISEFETIPLGIIQCETAIVTVCTKQLKMLDDFRRLRKKNFDTEKKIRTTLYFMYKSTEYFMLYLKRINRMSNMIESELHKSMENEELMQLLSLEKSLVYFTTSLKANEIVFEKLMRLDTFRKYPEDKEMIEDLLIENRQAIEMSTIYGSILNGTMSAVGSIISNNLNIVMKFLTSVTIVMAIPTIISSFMGMNVPVPLTEHPFGFVYLLFFTVIATVICVYIMVKLKMF